MGVFLFFVTAEICSIIAHSSRHPPAKALLLSWRISRLQHFLYRGAFVHCDVMSSCHCDVIVKIVPEKNCHFFAFFSLKIFIWRRMKIWLAVSFFEREGPFWFGSVGVVFWYCSVWHRCCGWLFVDFLRAKNFKIPTLILPRGFCDCDLWLWPVIVMFQKKIVIFLYFSV